MRQLLISDPTLRDGSHAIQHQLTRANLVSYCKLAEQAGIPIVEVGHGNGLGASSLQLGESLLADEEMLTICRENLRQTKLAIHVIPGFATIHRDLRVALDLGVDIVRVASHCTEADLTKRHIEYTRKRGRTAYGVLMMSHMASASQLAVEALKMQSYGAEGIVLMDSAGAYLPKDVKAKVQLLCSVLTIPVGFHAHNNLGLAVGNSLAAVQAGATLLDGTARGFGAGAGNAQLEALVAALHHSGFTTGIDLFRLLELADEAEASFVKAPKITTMSIVGGMAGVFSGFVKPVERIAAEYGLDPKAVMTELGKRKVIAGQEDLILETAVALAKKSQQG
jgi:4-hydroxy 2-oxovalerate aldolase